MSKSFVNIVVLLASAVLCWTAEPVCAGPSRATVEMAKSFRLQGEGLLRDKRAADAIKALANSYVLFQSPGVLMLLGRALLDHGKYRDAAEFCQRFLREQPEAKEAYVASMCRTMAVASGSGESLVDIDGLSLTVLRDLNLADVHMLLGNYGLAEKFAEQFLTEVPASSKSRQHAIKILRAARGFQGKSDPYQSQPRPRWRKALGSLTLMAGIGLSAWGAGVLAYDGHCTGNFGIDPRTSNSTDCPEIYKLGPYGGSVVGVGVAALLTGTVLLAYPGRPSERQAIHLDLTLSGLAFASDF